MNSATDARFYSWNRRLARRAMAPFLSTNLRPNHVTTLRLMVGMGALALLAVDSWPVAVLGGVLWVFSAFLDRCDGEFARMSGRSTLLGKYYDLAGDIVMNSLVFLAIGVGLGHDTVLGRWALPLGGIAATGILVASICAEWNERGMAPGKKTFNGLLGFDFDDLTYLIAVFVWCGQGVVLLVGGALGGVAAAVCILIRLLGKI